MHQCFVISPIGQEGSEIRKHADDVFEYVIKPAMDACNIKAFRSDHLDKPGKISEQMFQAIYTSDLCIAVLTGHNPNVFYELAIAQSAQRPVIILIEKGQQLPFDIKDLRYIDYDLEIRSYNEKTYINKVINYVRDFESMNWAITDLLGEYRPRKTAGPLGVPAFGEEKIDDVLRELRERLPPDLLLPILRKLFNRNTFNEKIEDCVAQDWVTRFHVACLVEKILQAYSQSVSNLGTSDQKSFYEALQIEVRGLCHNMIGLFKSRFSLAQVEQYLYNADDLKKHLPRPLSKDEIEKEVVERCDMNLKKVSGLWESLGHGATLVGTAKVPNPSLKPDAP